MSNDDTPQVTDAETDDRPGPDVLAEEFAEPEEPESSQHVARTEHVGDIFLMDDEEVLYDLQPSWRQHLSSIAIWVGVTVLTAGLGLLVAWYPLLKIYRRTQMTRYIITSERVIVQEAGGLFGTSQTTEYPIRDLADIQSRATASQRRADCGTVSFTERDGERSTVELGWIPDYEEVASALGAYQRRLDPHGRRTHHAYQR